MSLHPVVVEIVVVGGVDGSVVVGGVTVDVLVVVVGQTLQSPQDLGQELQRYV